MEPTEEELTRFFRAMDDEQLLVAAYPKDLTELAYSVALSEMKRRGLQPRAVEPAPPQEAHDGAPMVTVERFRDLSAAIVARSALEAAEIPCLLRDENTVRMDWQISNFIGGMRLQVMPQDEESARAVLGGLALDEDEELEAGALPGESCPVCGSVDIHRERRHRGVALAALLVFSVPLPRGAETWICGRCGHQWKDD